MLYVLYEHATGYGLFHVQEVEEVGALLPTVERAITEAALFKTIVKLVAFSPFKSGTNALDNTNSISEGIVHDDLKLFLETNVPTGKKGVKAGVQLGVSDPRISGTLQDELGIKCTGGDAVTEIFRGLRLHFSNLVKGLTPLGEAKAQLGLGHSYSRAKVKFNVHRADNMIIQSIALLDQLDKDINTFSMRVREWYSYHFPELVKIVNDNYMYCRMVHLIKNRKRLFTVDEELMEKMEEITMDSAKAKAVVDASKMSMGMDISPIDLINIESFSARVISLTEYRRSLVTYLHGRMESVAPNLASLIGDMVGARLISHAGSLTNLAKYPASTVQILGAEKALFRALKTKGNTPKYGLIFHSTFIGRAAAKNKGRISRFLANKCSIASRIDCFAETPTNIYGEKLKDQVEERLKFFDTGDAPRKNVDVMKEAFEEVAHLADSEASAAEDTMNLTENKKKKKKKKKRKTDADDEIIAMIATDKKTPANESEENGEAITEPPMKKKKKKKSKADESMEVAEQSTVTDNNDSAISTEDEGEKKTKKKKKRKAAAEQESETVDTSAAEQSVDSVDEEGAGKKIKKRKKKKTKSTDEPDEEVSIFVADETILAGGGEGTGKKKKRKSKSNDTAQSKDLEISATADETEAPKKKKKKRQEEDTSALEVSAKVNGSSHDESQEDAEKGTKKKKKKGLDASTDVSMVGVDSVSNATETPKKVKKAKKKKSMGADG